MYNLIKISFFVCCFISSTHCMKQESVKRIFDHKQQQFVKVPSLVDRAADVYVASQLVPACKQLSGANVDTLGNDIIHQIPYDLRPLMIGKLLTQAPEHGWKIGFKDKKPKEEKQPRLKKENITDHDIQQNILVKLSGIYHNKKTLTFYAHIEAVNNNDAETPYWTALQKIEDLRDCVFSLDKRICFTLQSGGKTVNAYQKMNGTYEVISMIPLEREMFHLYCLDHAFFSGNGA